jgi:hypothetical protein
MADPIKWEYRVRSFGSGWTAMKDDELESNLNEWGEEGWEVVTATVDTSRRVRVIAKRPLAGSPRRRRYHEAEA